MQNTSEPTMLPLKAIKVLSVWLFLSLINHVISTRCVVPGNSLATASSTGECSETEYRTYVDCIRRRSKRYTDCTDCSGEQCEDASSCGECDCNLCSYSDCSSQCKQCCQNYPAPCTTRSCCQATCHSTCRTSHCRRNCRTRCATTIAKTSVVKEASPVVVPGSKLESLAKHNITTVINLHNVINNTNVVDIPVSINSTNYNNITLEAGEPGAVNVELHNTQPAQPSQTHYVPVYPPVQEHPEPPVQPEPPQPKDPCCYIVFPRQCVPTSEPPFSKCFNEKKRMCSDVCRSSIVHAEPYRVCDEDIHHVHSSSARCHDQVAYIPQPLPRCFSSAMWPYVQCSLMSPNCGGCYRHIVHGGEASRSCSPACYDSSTNLAPYYPLYQTSYNIPSFCASGGCLPFAAGMTEGPAMNALAGQSQGWNRGFAVQSIDKTFGYVPQDAQSQSYAGDYTAKRSPQADEQIAGGRTTEEGDSKLEYSVEEIPIKLETV